MAYVEERPIPRGRAGMSEHHSELARAWRRLTRVATGVAVLTSPALYLLFHDANHSFVLSLVLTIVALLLFRGLVDVIVHRFIPWPSMYGADGRREGRRPGRPPAQLDLEVGAVPAASRCSSSPTRCCSRSSSCMLVVGGVSAPFFNPGARSRG